MYCAKLIKMQVFDLRWKTFWILDENPKDLQIGVSHCLISSWIIKKAWEVKINLVCKTAML